MDNKRDLPSGRNFVDWSEKYATGIETIDRQHKELVELINRLYGACMQGGDGVGSAFREAMHRMVEYVRFHLMEEMKLLERIGYPKAAEHKIQHDILVRDILSASRDFEEGETFVPNKFVRSLKDWVFGHIAVYDKAYAEYVTEQKKKGLLGDL